MNNHDREAAILLATIDGAVAIERELLRAKLWEHPSVRMHHANGHSTVNPVTAYECSSGIDRCLEGDIVALLTDPEGKP